MIESTMPNGSLAIPPDALYTLEQAAVLKGVSYRTVMRAVRSGILPPHHRGNLTVVSGADLATWQPMRRRAPLAYQHRSPDPAVIPLTVESRPTAEAISAEERRLIEAFRQLRAKERTALVEAVEGLAAKRRSPAAA